MLGEVCLYSFIIIILTGVYLTLFFHPSMNEIEYHGAYVPMHGVRMTEAYASTLDISFDVRGGLLIRQIHHWAALIFIAGMFDCTRCASSSPARSASRARSTGCSASCCSSWACSPASPATRSDDLLSGTGVRFTQRRDPVGADRRHVHLDVPVRRRVRPRHGGPVLLDPHPAAAGHHARPRGGAPDPGLLPQAHAVPGSPAGRTRTSSACRCCRSTWPRREASSSWSSASSRSSRRCSPSTRCGPSARTARTWCPPAPSRLVHGLLAEG